ncbi:MAG: biopolymer transporter ExbD [Thermodesulfobacteriota bacterium]|nr:biopolymer transporter ExbD [Thermodesulfobacteriota bacterium]
MALRRHHHQPIHLNIAPLVDMIFLLLIFFLLTSSFILDEGLKINLPAAQSSQMQDREDVTISIIKDGRILLNGEIAFPETLLAKLTRIMKESPDKGVIIKADRQIILENAVKVLDTVKLAGATKIVIATETEPKR